MAKPLWVVFLQNQTARGIERPLLFSALPGGNYNNGNGFNNAGYNGNWWSSTANDENNAWNRNLNYNNTWLNRNNNNRNNGFSVRCVRD